MNQMVDAKPGDLILWRSVFHSTGGTKDLNRCNICAFVDWTPSSTLDSWMVDWMAFCYSNAPMDFGSGRARGGWSNILVDARRCASGFSSRDLCFGEEHVGKYVNTQGLEDEKPFYKLASEWEAFEKRGFMVIRPPDESALHTLTPRITAEFQKSLRWLANDPKVDLADSVTIKRMFTRKTAGLYYKEHHPDMTDPEYTWYTDLFDNKNPYDPLCTLGKSHNPRAGGIGIAGDSGMGPWTTLCLENHLKVQYDPFVRGLMRSYYAFCMEDDVSQLRMVPVLERLRCKATKPWGNSHVDVACNTEAIRARLCM